MIARIVALMTIVTLALPNATLTSPEENGHAPWSASSVVAKGKQHKKNRKQNDTTRVTTPQFITATRTVRGAVTRTFTGADGIRIPSFGMAAPYPSEIPVSGFINGAISDVDLILHDLTHAHPADIDVLLSNGVGRRALVMSDVGDTVTEGEIDLVLDDEAAESMPFSRLRSGTFRPTDVLAIDDTFASPAPAPNGSVALSTFDGADPNGSWQLWVMDNGPGVAGEIRGGWELRITAEVDLATVDEQVPIDGDSIQNTKTRKKAKKRKN